MASVALEESRDKAPAFVCARSTQGECRVCVCVCIATCWRRAASRESGMQRVRGATRRRDVGESCHREPMRVEDERRANPL